MGPVEVRRDGIGGSVTGKDLLESFFFWHGALIKAIGGLLAVYLCTGQCLVLS